MATTRENYQISAIDLEGLVSRLNFILARIADRLDKVEGLRTELETQGGTFAGDINANGDLFVNDEDSNRIHSME